MSPVKLVRQIEAADLTRAKQVARAILHDWDLMSWNGLLADNVTLSIRLGAAGIVQIGGLVTVNGNLQVFGRVNTMSVLRIVFPDLMSGLSVTRKIVNGYDIALLGDWTVGSMERGVECLSVRTILWMIFNDQERIERVTIAALHLNPPFQDFC
jgi:hypothetical protein